MTRIDQELIHLLDLKQIEKIDLSGDEKHCLGEDLLPFIAELRKAIHIKTVKLQGNKIQDAGYSLISQFIRASKTIEKITLDDSGAQTCNVFSELASAVTDCHTMISFSFPTNDAKQLIKCSKKKK